MVPFAPGGGVDVTARILAQQLTQRVGQSFLVENRTGASGVITGEGQHMFSSPAAAVTNGASP